MTQDRLRDPPRDRFAGEDRLVDLGEVFERLPSESVERRGHIQKTIHKHGRLTSAVFTFDTAARLDAHTVQGEAVLHVLEGWLDVKVGEERRQVRAGQMILLDPGVEHEVEALEPSKVLMHVVLEG